MKGGGGIGVGASGRKGRGGGLGDGSGGSGKGLGDCGGGRGLDEGGGAGGGPYGGGGEGGGSVGATAMSVKVTDAVVMEPRCSGGQEPSNLRCIDMAQHEWHTVHSSVRKAMPPVGQRWSVRGIGDSGARA